MIDKFPLAVNVSPKQFRQTNFVNLIKNKLDSTYIKPNHLTLGIRFSIDDFGTGYSSLSYLRLLPLNQLLDQLTRLLSVTVPNDEVIVETIISMGNLLSLEVIAEGVETEEQVRFLANRGCSSYQGYYFGKPVPIENFTSKLEKGTDSCLKLALIKKEKR